MAFALSYRPTDNTTLARKRWEGNWILSSLMSHAKSLGWDERESLVIYDLDGVAIAGFVPNEL
jgi:hypothetical protein